MRKIILAVTLAIATTVHADETVYTEAMPAIKQLKEATKRRDEQIAATTVQIKAISARLAAKPNVDAVKDTMVLIKEQAHAVAEACADLKKHWAEYVKIVESEKGDIVRYVDAVKKVIRECDDIIGKETDKDFIDNFKNMKRIYESLLEMLQNRQQTSLDNVASIDAAKKRIDHTESHMRTLAIYAAIAAGTMDEQTEALKQLKDQVVNGTAAVNANLKKIADSLERGVKKLPKIEEKTK